MGRKSPYSDQTRRLSAYLFENTPITCEEAAELIGVPHNTLKVWWAKLPKPPHRGGSGSRPQDKDAAKKILIADLTAEVEMLRAKLAAKEENPLDTDELIKDLKTKLRSAMFGARLGEIAAALRVLTEIQREEAPSGDEARVIEYQIPAGEERPPEDK